MTKRKVYISLGTIMVLADSYSGQSFASIASASDSTDSSLSASDSTSASASTDVSRMHTVTFQDAYGNVIANEKVPDGGDATYDWAWPTKRSGDDTIYYYYFKGWDQSLEDVKSDLVLKPVFGVGDMSEWTVEEASDGSYYLPADFAYTGSAVDLYLPSTYNGQPITAIKTWAINDQDLVTIHIPSTYKDFESIFCVEYYTPNLAAFDVDPANAYVTTDATGVLYSKDMTTLFQVPYSYPYDSYEVPESVTALKTYALNALTTVKDVKIGGQVSELPEFALVDSLFETVELGYGIEYIDHEALANLVNVTQLTIPGSVETLGVSAITGLSSLTTLVLEDGLKYIGSNAIDYNTALVDVTFPSTLVSIDTAAFMGDTALTSIDLPEGLTSIGTLAFADDTALADISLPSTLVSIGEAAFRNVSATSIEIPANLASFTYDLFQGDSALTSYTVAEGNEEYSSQDGLLLNKAGTDLVAVPSGQTSLTNIPSSVTAIGQGAAYANMNLTEVSLPDSVKSVGASAFTADQNLVSLDLGSVESLGDYAFESTGVQWSDSGLSSVTIPASVKSIGTNVFALSSNLDTVVFEDGVPYVGDGMFEFDSSLANVTLPSSITTIGGNAFAYDTGLKSIALPESLESIGTYGFYDTGLTSVTIPASVDSIGTYSFGSNYSLASVDIEADLTEIPEGAFAYCFGITSLELPTTVTKIGKSAFASLGITSIDLPDSLTSIGDYAFSYSQLRGDLALPENVSYIGAGAFNGTSISSVTIPASVKFIGQYALPSGNLTTINFEGTTAEWAKIAKAYYWDGYYPTVTQIVCTDGTVTA